MMKVGAGINCHWLKKRMQNVNYTVTKSEKIPF